MAFARTGAIFYVLWGMLHIIAAYEEFLLGTSLEPGIVLGKINQGAWDLLFIAMTSIIIAIIYNWKNSLSGYWINLVLVSIADIGFIFFIMIPGYAPFFPTILGPVFWVLAILFSTIAIRKKVL